MRPEFVKLAVPLPIGIIGLGISGKAIHQLILESGVGGSNIFVFDEKETTEFKSLDAFLSTKRPKSICVSPGVPLSKPEIISFINSGGRLTSELEIATAFLSDEKIIAITGSIGKSTVTALIGEAGKVADPEIFVGGNLGIPLADYALKKIQGIQKNAKYIVLELSSYQLENYKNLDADCGVLTYLSPNHMERYSSLQHYYDTKISMFSHLKKYLVCNSSGGDITEYLKNKLAPEHLSRFFVDRKSFELHKYFSRQPALLGKHNLDNLALTFRVCELFNWPEDSFAAALNFKGLPHRLENCGEKSGILFINDSKATAMDPVHQAFISIREQFADRPIHLLLGGKDKDLPWQNLNILGRQKNLTFYFFGSVGPIAKQKSRLSGEVFPKLADCLENLEQNLKPNDIVLFSPGGTSWDEFKSFEERGDYFKKWIQLKF